MVSAHREENINNPKNFSGLIDSLNLIAEKYGFPIIVSTHPRTRKKLEELQGQDKSIKTKDKSEVLEDKSVKTKDKSEVLEDKSVKTKDKSEKDGYALHPLIKWQKPLGFSDYNALQINAFAVLSDSGTISEESSIMNFRALNIREAHERPEAMEEASVMMVGLNPERIMQGLVQLQYQETGEERSFGLLMTTPCQT